MIGTSKVSVLPWLAAAALLCSATVPGANAAWAQTADNLKCNKCVDKKDLAKGAVRKRHIKKGAVEEKRLSTDLQEHVNQREAFYITLDGNGSTATIATNGPLSFFARCLLNQPDGGGGFEDRIEIVATSSVAGWFEEDESSDSGDPPLTAGQEVIVETDTVDTPGASRVDSLSEAVSGAPDGSYLGLEGDAGISGQNVFGHDCIVAGNAYRITGAL